MHKVDLSIIIPAYNAEQYLSKCLDSLVKQKVCSFEVIVVNDGSLDQTESIVLEYKRQYSFIKLLNKENGGVSSARNMGLQFAKGEFIGFVDPDDYVDANMFLEMLNVTREKNVDIVMCGYREVYESNNSYEVVSSIREGVYNEEEIKTDILTRLIGINKYDLQNNLEHGIFGQVWRCIFRRNIITTNELLFLEGVDYGEDEIFLITYLMHSSSFYMLNKPLYNYVRHKTSLTMSKNISKMNRNMITLIEKKYEILKYFKVYKTFEEEYYYYVCRRVIEVLLNQEYNNFKGLYKNIKKIINNSIIYNVILNESKYLYSSKISIKIILINIKKRKSIFLILYLYIRNLIHKKVDIRY